MRIISGARKGKLLHTLEGNDTRPTPDLVKGAIFNIIRPRVAGARVLDLFAGTGTLGLEALSGGAEQAAFVEANPAAVSLLKRNLHSIQAGPRATVLAVPAGRAIRQLQTRAERFQIIFCDPPFAAMKQLQAPLKDDTIGMAELLKQLRDLLAADGLLVLRYESGDAIEPLAGFVPLSAKNPARRYGRSTVALAVRSEEPGAQFVFPKDAEFRGHRPKNSPANVARRGGESAPLDEDEDGALDAEPGEDTGEHGEELDEA